MILTLKTIKMSKEMLIAQLDNYILGLICVIGVTILFFMYRESYLRKKFKRKLLDHHKSSHK